MKAFYIKSDRIFLEADIFSGYIKIEDKTVKDITNKAKEDIQIIDYTGKIIAPGYFDTHVHGYGGYDVMDATKEALMEISQGIVSTGVTSFLATTLTDSTEKLNRACENVAENKDFCQGAKIQGIFLEGPFFSHEYKGAQNPKYMENPDIDKLKNWKKLSENLVNKIAIAPELENSEDFIKESVKSGVNIALGHSNATYEQAKKAVDCGAKIFVHLYNAMSLLHHRNPGMVGAGLTTSNTYCEVICDGYHAHPAAVDLILKAKSPDNTVLITDCMMAGGMPEGDYKLGEFDVAVKDGAARLTSGSLAGSILKLYQAVQNVVKWKIATPFDAVKMASLVPAKSVGLDDKIGSIKIGKYADINILNEDMSVFATYIDGVKKFQS